MKYNKNGSNDIYIYIKKCIVFLVAQKPIVKKQRFQENMNTPVNCRCGRAPERNTESMGYRYSFSCKCGGTEINFVTRSDSQQVALDNWESLITGKSYKHAIVHMKDPYSTPSEFAVPNLEEPYGPNPLRRWVRARGGHCSGGGGCC